MERFENAKIGDEVFCEVYGDGKIVSCRDLVSYRILVEFMSSARESYTLDGRMHKKAIKPTLFYRKGTERNLTKSPVEEINWKEWEGKEILVRDSANQGWAKKTLYRYQPEFTFRFACESQTDKTMPTSWKYAKLIEPSSFSAMSVEYANHVEEKPQEIDWTKVATGTQVIVSDSDDFYPCNTREFFMYRPDLEYKFWVFDGDEEEAYGYKYCKIV